MDIEALAQQIFGMTKGEAHERGICVQCKQPAMNNCYSEDGRKEYHLSGLCEKCFDSIFNNEGE